MKNFLPIKISCFLLSVFLLASSCLSSCEKEKLELDQNKKTTYPSQVSVTRFVKTPTKNNVDLQTRTPNPVTTPSPTTDLNAIINLEEAAWGFLEQPGSVELTKTIDQPFGTQIRTVRLTPLLFIPLRPDFFLDVSTELQLIPVSAKMTFQLAHEKSFFTSKNLEIRLGIISNTYNYQQTAVAALVLSVRDSAGNALSFVERTSVLQPVVTYIALRDDIYPNKIENIFIGLQRIAQYQEENGGFKESKTISFLRLIGLENGELFNVYKDGNNKFYNPVRANGICAIATGISSLLSENGYESYMFQERWTHQEMYHQGPFSPISKKVDAAIEFGPETARIFDLKFIPQEDGFFHINTHLFETGVEFSETWINGNGGLSDVGLIVTYSFSPDYKEQSEVLKNQVDNFIQYRESKHTVPINIGSFDRVVEYKSLANPGVFQWARLVYSVEETEHLIEKSPDKETLEDIVRLSEAINSYKESSADSLYSFLLSTDWYKGYLINTNVEILRVNEKLHNGTFRQIIGQPMQCVGFAMILTDLYPKMGFPVISGAIAETAGKLVPDFVYGLEGRFNTGYGEIALVGKSLELEDYHAGDFFVIKGDPGHVGAILGQFDGFLLVADSNRL